MVQEKASSLALHNKIVLLAVAVVPWLFATAFSAYEDVKWAAMVALAGVGALVLGLDVVRGRALTLPGGRIGGFAYTLGLFVLFSLTYAVNALAGLKEAATWVAAVVLFLLAVSARGRGLRFVEFARAVAVSVVGVAVMGLLDFAGVGLFTVVWNPFGPTGSFDAMEFLTPFYAVSLPILAAGVLRDGSKSKALLGLALVAGAVHFGMTVTSMLGWIVLGAVLVTSLLLVVLQGFGRSVLLYPAFGLVLVVGILVGGVAMFAKPQEAFSDANRLPLALFEVVTSTDQLVDGQPRVANFAIGRMEEIRDVAAWQYTTGVAFDLWRDSPVGGHGAGGWWLMQTKFPREKDPFVVRMFEQYPAFQSAHNSLAQALAEFGAVGIILLLAWLSAVAGVTVTALARREEPENWILEHWGLTAGCLAFFGVSVMTPAMTLAGGAVVFFPALGLLVRESAVLNGFQGLSAPWMVGGEQGGVLGKVFAGLVPVLVGLGLVAVSVVVTTSNYHRGLGDHLMLRTKFKEAGERYAAAHAAYPARGEVLYNEALTHRRTGKIAGAESLIANAKLLRPNDARIELLAAVYAANKQQVSDVVTGSMRATSLFPNYVDGHKQLALGYDMGGRLTEAAAAIKHLIDLDPPDRFKATLYGELARYYEDTLDQPKQAAEAYSNAAKYTKDKINRDQWEFRAKELAKQVERDRLIREGKQVPKELMPAQPQGHDHGLPANLQPNVPDPNGHGPHDGHDH